MFEIIQPGGDEHLTEKDLPLRIGGEGCHIQLPGFNKELCLIGQIDGYLFLQPISEQVDIFHNNEKATSSVWIKSGDQTRIGTNIIHYTIHGDIVTIELAEGIRQAPTKKDRYAPDIDRRTLPKIQQQKEGKQAGNVWPKIGLFIMALLTGMASFVLIATSIKIDITPEPDSLSISGLAPVLRLGKRFLSIPGRYELLAEKKGYKTLQKELQISRDNPRFSFRLIPLPGKIDVTTSPEQGANIEIDQDIKGISPLKDIELEAGNHTILITKERFKDIEHTIKVAGKGIHQHFDFILQPAWGSVSLTSKPQGAEIVVDNKKTGLKTPAVLQLSEGKRKILLKLTGHKPGEIVVSISAGRLVSPKTVVLKKAQATLTITSNPRSALVAADGIYMGKTPLKIELVPEKQHKIIVSAKGYKPVLKTIHLAPGVLKEINFRLPPQYCTVFITSPPEAKLFIDGHLQGKNGGRFRLLAMAHNIEIRGPDGLKSVRKITPLPGSTISVDMRFRIPGKGRAAKIKEMGHNLILFPAAIFTMGTSRREPGRRTNEVMRKVILTRPFYISETEVTNAQFRRFKRDHSSGSFHGFNLNGDSQPVVNVTWEEAARYLNWLSQQEGLTPFYLIEDGKIKVAQPITNGYRLPTEAEWAWAARFAKRKRGSKYPWPGPFPPPPKAGNFADESARAILPVVITGYIDSFPVTAPVASFKANPAGLFDIGGNVSEWCHDFYSPFVTIGSKAEKDPLGPASGTHHVVRGASWKDSSITELRLSYRGYSRKATNYIGFRVARYAR